MKEKQAQAAGQKLAHLLVEDPGDAGLRRMLDEEYFWVGVDGKELTLPVSRRPGRIAREHYRTAALSGGEACVTAWLEVCPTQGEGPQGTPGQPMCITMVMRLRADAWRAVYLHDSLLPPGGPEERAEWFADLWQAQERTERLRAEDPLTGILNLDGFVKAVCRLQAQNAGQPYAFVKITINRFSIVNQIYGYDLGDEVLRGVARGLQRACEAGEACCRVEKDNFAVFWRFEDRQLLEKRLLQARRQLEEQKTLARLGQKLTFSAGVYLPQPGTDEPVKAMLDKTLDVLREMQGTGRSDRLEYFHPRLFAKKKHQGELLQQASAAMEKGEFELYIQPQVDLKTGEVVAGEALARWQQPGRKLLTPASFIPLFEEDGLILEFDYYMLDTLCRQMRRWIDRGILLPPISINQSRLHVREPGYLERFVQTVDRWRIPHGYLAFELTESAFVQEREQMFRLAQRLHRLNFQLEIDDFGTGYASLNLIGLLAADVLKIDRSLLEGADHPTNRRSCKVLEKVIEMAHETGMTVVCEGVETARQARLLAELGCDVAQGFYYYRPMPAQQFEQQILMQRPLPLAAGETTCAGPNIAPGPAADIEKGGEPLERVF